MNCKKDKKRWINPARKEISIMFRFDFENRYYYYYELVQKYEQSFISVRSKTVSKMRKWT